MERAPDWNFNDLTGISIAYLQYLSRVFALYLFRCYKYGSDKPYIHYAILILL